MSDHGLKCIDVFLITFFKLPLHLLNHSLDSPLLALAQRSCLPSTIPRGIYLSLDDSLLLPLPGHLPLAVLADHHQVPLDLIRPRLLLPGYLHPFTVKLLEGRVHLHAQLPVHGESLPLEEGVLLESQVLGGGRMLGEEARSGEVGGVLVGKGGCCGLSGEQLGFEGVTEGFN